MAKHNLKTIDTDTTEAKVATTMAPPTEQVIDETGEQPMIVDLANIQEMADAEGEVEDTATEVVEEPKPVTGAIDLSLYANLGTKSAKIRAMAKDGHKTAAIARALEIRYQHARNVLAEPLKRTTTT